MLKKALSHHQKGQLPEAAALYGKILAREPKNADALHLLGVLEFQRKNPLEAIALIDRAIKLAPNNAMFFSNRGSALKDLKRFDEALASYDRALALKPDFAEALASRGNTLRDVKRFEDALTSHSFALAIKPDYAFALNGQGAALQDLKRFREALLSYDRALAINPGYAEAHNNRGNVLRDLRRFNEALASYDRALAIKPDYADALGNRGIILRDLKHFDEAVISFDRALAIDPDNASFFSLRLSCKMSICDWSGLGDDFSRLTDMIKSGQRAPEPFDVLAARVPIALQKTCSELYIQEKYPPNFLVPKIKAKYQHDKIRLGYFSADFRNHPVAHLMAELLEKHDPGKFEVIAFSFSPPTQDAIRIRLEKAFDRFIEVSAMSDKDVALLARKLEIDIAVDLNGFTTDGRVGIFAMRAAPIQVNYLGYPGTIGANYIDYLIADPTIIPEKSQSLYTEQIAYLPDTYMPTDSTRPIAESPVSRADHGLPENGFVFCCFNNAYKFSPEIFDVWMRLLNRVDGSVLWLPQSSDVSMKNLRSEATARGVDPARLAFARFLPDPQDHLARLRIADLFLDTLPYNAHATAVDALWAGLPVLTCLGTTFPGRVGASLLNALGLPELIAKDVGQYEALAQELVTNPQQLLLLREKLASHRQTHPLFNSDRFRKHIESAYTAMWRRHQDGQAPENIHVTA